MENIRYYPVGLLDTNCLLIRPRESSILYIVDPGAEGAMIADAADDMFSKRKKTIVLFTHAHVDHISGAGELADRIKVDSFFMPAPDADLYYSADNNLLPYLPAASDLPEITSLPPEDAPFEIIHTPGHTPGSVVYYFRTLDTLVSGDTLFRGSAGRTDLPGGDYDALMQSLKRIFFLVPDSARVIPGHGAETEMAYERRFNPYIQ